MITFYECSLCLARRVEEEVCFLLESGEPIDKVPYLRGEGKCYCAACGYDILDEKGMFDNGDDMF